MRAPLWIWLIALSAGCESTTRDRPDALGCEDNGCAGLGTFVTGGGGGGGGRTDAGLSDVTDPDAAALATVTGSLNVFTRFPAVTGAAVGDGGATGWTISPVMREDLVAMTDSAGRFTLTGVPTETFAGVPGRYFSLRARPVGMDFGSYQVFPATAGAANMLALSFSTLLGSVAGAMVTPDLSRGCVVLFFIDSAGTVSRPVAGVTVDNIRDTSSLLYDNELGTLSSTLSASGASGVAAIVNIATLSTESRNGHPFAFRVTRGGRSASYNTLVFPQTITWMTLLAP